MTLQAGVRLGPYEVTGLLGAGGMGEVYRARDTRLDRTVAIKVLPEALASDRQFRERFEREARTISQLDHPHICTLYDVGEQDGTSYLVMQYLEGETIEQRLRRGALPLDHAFQISIQIADALDTAHRAGIVHRDLKPGNIMLTRTGAGSASSPHAKLLDFGLAKTGSSVVAVAGVSRLPTTPPNLTAEGAILGTFQYMAPEQLEGREADVRTDIFAFGAVVYEMITGQKAFEAKSHASLIHMIMGVDPPPISTAQPRVSTAFERAVKKCLSKDPDRRWQSARDLSDELSWIVEGPPVVATGPSADLQRLRRRAHLAWGAASVFGLALFAALIYGLRLPARSSDQPITRFDVYLPAGSVVGGDLLGRRFAISPDGRKLALIIDRADGERQLWIQSFEAGVLQLLAGTDGAINPFWSPDNRQIAFFAQGKLKQLDLSGGPPQIVADANTDAANNAGGTWSPDGRTMVFATSPGTLFAVPAAGGTPVAVSTLDRSRGDISHRWPQFLPDGRHVVYLALNSDPRHAGAFVRDIVSNEEKPLVTTNGEVAYAAGYLLFRGETGALMARGFDLGNLTLTGDAFRVADSVRQGILTANVAFSASNKGVLIYESAGLMGLTRLRVFTRGGAEKELSELSPGTYQNIELSPDGSRLALVLVRLSPERSRDIWIHDLMRGITRPFTFSGDADSPQWSRDGTYIAYRRPPAIYRKLATGVGEEEMIASVPGAAVLQDWSPDGRLLLERIGKAADLWFLPTDRENVPSVLLRTDSDERHGRVSPNGRWVAYVSNRSGRFEVYVRPSSLSSAEYRLSKDGGTQPRWRQDGKELVYTTVDGRFMSVSIEEVSGGIEAKPPIQLFESRQTVRVASGAPYSDYAMTPDAQQFYLLALADNADATGKIHVVLNWEAASKK